MITIKPGEPLYGFPIVSFWYKLIKIAHAAVGHPEPSP